MGLSRRQCSVLECVQQFVAAKGYAPSLREIGEATGIGSTSEVRYNLNLLQDKGYLRRQPRVSRGVRLIPQTLDHGRGTLRVPVIGRIVASSPLLVLDGAFGPGTLQKSAPLPDEDGRSDDPVYALEVQGNSMKDELIHDGDLVILKRTTEIHNGDLVVAWLKSENAATLKCFYRENGRVRLQPRNMEIEPIYVHPSDLEVQGKVIAIVSARATV
jgi:repressor LexA